MWILFDFSHLHVINQIYLVALTYGQLSQVSFLQKNDMLQNSFLKFVTLSGFKNHGIWTFKVNFLCLKMFKSFLKNELKNINLGPHFLWNTFFDKFKIERLLFLKWRLIFDGPCEHLWNSNQKIIFILLIFLLKSFPCWLTSAKLHHWGHTNNLPIIIDWTDLSKSGG